MKKKVKEVFRLLETFTKEERVEFIHQYDDVWCIHCGDLQGNYYSRKCQCENDE